MNVKAWIVSILFLAWSGFCWFWIQSKKESCCSPEKNTVQTPVGIHTNSIPLYFTLNSNIPKKGTGFDEYKTKLLSDIGPNDTLRIQSWYFGNEENGELLAGIRAENLKKLFPEIPKERIKIQIDKHAESMDPNSQGFEASSFNILPGSQNLVQKLKDKILIYFPPGSSDKTLDPQVDHYLDTLSQEMKSRPDVRVKVSGYTDNSGDSIRNNALSEKRALFLKTQLIKKGIDSSRVSSEGMGQSNPIATNTTEKGKSLNRRVELTLIHP